MATQSEIEKQRDKFIRDNQERLASRVSSMQTGMYSVILDVISGLKTDGDGIIRNSFGNVNLISQLNRALNRFHIVRGKSLLEWVFSKLGSLFNLNTRYFKADPNLKGKTESIEERTKRLLLASYGFDTRKNTLIPGGYLTGITSSEVVANQLGRLINSSLGVTSLPDFRRALRQQFLNPGGLGMVEAQFRRFSGDLFAQFDRQTGEEYATSLKLNHATYAGTEKNNSRCFCRQRIGGVFTREVINGWNDLQWRGKNTHADVKVALGGIFCRHRLNWISDEAAPKIAKRRSREINELNSVDCNIRTE